MNYHKFIKELNDSMEDLSDVKFAVCGFGNHSYKYYYRADSRLFELLKQHLAKPIIPLVKIDTSVEDKGETAFEGWCQNLIKSLGLKPPKIEVHLNNSLNEIDDDTFISNPLNPVGFELGIMKIKTIVTPEELKGTNHQMSVYQI